MHVLKKMNKIMKSSITWILILVLCVSAAFSAFPSSVRAGAKASASATPSPFNGNEADLAIDTDSIDMTAAIHITTVTDLRNLSDNCKLDSWSQGKVFLLDCDLDFSNIPFTPIPTFGGIFLGNGHTISGLSLTGGSDVTGLFRYVQEGGEIYNLKVSAKASAESGHSSIGLIVGKNSGLISGCQVTGTVSGGDNVGMLAGENDVTGILYNCKASGIAYGNHRIGGIAGENDGAILSCVNAAEINTTVEESDLDITTLTIEDILSTENVASVTDIGGIAGKNTGIIRACVNNGAVGYNHVGYNIGGIAGSQIGYIEGCINYGVLNGRKDVGGIAGQMEPSSEMLYKKDTLDKLADELDILHDLITKLNDDAKNTSTVLTDQVDVLLNAVEDTQRAVDGIMDEASDDMNAFSSELTNLKSLPSPDDISLDFLNSIPSASVSPTASAEPTDGEGSEEGKGTQGGKDQGNSGLQGDTDQGNSESQSGTEQEGNQEDDNHENEGEGDEQSDNSSEANSADPDSSKNDTTAAKSLVPSTASTAAVIAIDRYNANNLQKASSGSYTASQAAAQPHVLLASIKKAPDASTSPSVSPSRSPFSIPTISADLDVDDFDREAAEEELNKIQDSLYDSASTVLDDTKNTLSNRTSILSNRLQTWRSSLSSSFSSIISSTRTLNSMLDDQNQLLLDDLQAITDELNVISDILQSADEDVPDTDDMISDVSDEDTEQDTTGKVMNCQNRGKIYGDLNVGGIAGSMSEENDLDPEDDLSISDDFSLNFSYQQRIVIRKSQNVGVINSKKNCAGGIVGNMELGSIISCLGNGDVTSDDGDMVGGIAGYSASNIRDSSAKCALSGDQQIGGIAGYGTTISGCYSMIAISEGNNYLGSIAGKVDDLDDVSENYFVENGTAGIDSISYMGKAEPVSYGSFMTLDDLPEIYENVTLSFMADDQLVKTITLSYGESLDPTALPAVPEKEGYVGVWEDFDRTSLTFDQTINAVYTEYLSTIDGSKTDENGRPYMLIEGTFEEGDSFLLTSIDLYPEDAKTTAECRKVKITGGEGPYTVRFLIPDGFEHLGVQLYEDGEFKKIDGETDGSYYVFETDQSEFIFALVEQPTSVLPIVISAVVALLVVMVILLKIKHRKMK